MLKSLKYKHPDFEEIEIKPLSAINLFTGKEHDIMRSIISKAANENPKTRSGSYFPIGNSCHYTEYEYEWQKNIDYATFKQLFGIIL